jgi:hypothetical protein
MTLAEQTENRDAITVGSGMTGAEPTTLYNSMELMLLLELPLVFRLKTKTKQMERSMKRVKITTTLRLKKSGYQVLE